MLLRRSSSPQADARRKVVQLARRPASPPARREALLLATLGAPGALMGCRASASTKEDERAPRAGCVFCAIVRGEGTRKTYEDELVVAFHDIRPAARVHLQVVPKAHIEDSSHLQNSGADASLVRSMLAVGQKLVSQLAPDAETKFGFHDQPFLSVPHLHLHCFALPHTSPLVACKYIVPRRVGTGFVTPEGLLQRMAKRPPA